MRTSSLLLSLFMACSAVCAQTSSAPAGSKGGLSTDDLSRLRESYKDTPADRAVRNALFATDINAVAKSAENQNNFDNYISHRVPSKGVTDQKSSGRCWLFSGLNVLRAQMMNEHNTGKMEFSQVYLSFYDLLEKSNMFLQNIIDTANRPIDDRRVDFLLSSPIGDGGTFTGVADLVEKYGVVPKSVMLETYASEHTSVLRQLLNTKLREDALALRELAAKKASAAKLQALKHEQLADIYRMLCLALGEPPTEFTWTRYGTDGKPVDTRTYTPKEFYMEYLGNNLTDDYVLLMNDPTRPYWQTYEIDLDRHTYDGHNWVYVNVPMEEIKNIAIESIKDSTMMYMSCDVGKQLDRSRGYLDPANYDYSSLMGVDFGMDKRERILSHASASSHAMTMMGVDLDPATGEPRRWMVENSWGNTPGDGHLVMSDRWLDEYLFRLVVNRKYATPQVLEALKLKPVLLPPWDPMFLADE